jgi:hypothetical protein
MRAYSQDLRERIISAVSSEAWTQAETAEEFSVSLSFVQKLWYRWRETGDSGCLRAPRRQDSGARGHEAAIRAEVELQSHATYLLHYRRAFACSSLPYPHSRRLTLRLTFLLIGGGTRAYHVPRLQLDGLGLASTPVALSSAAAELGAAAPVHAPFGPSLSASLACYSLRRLRRFTFVDHTIRSWFLTASMLAVATLISRLLLPLRRVRLHCPGSFAPQSCRRRTFR